MIKDNLQSEIEQLLSDEMQKEIDIEIHWGILTQIGWTRVLIDRYQDNNHAIDITLWLEENCKGAYDRHGRGFLFENEKDATMFILKWS